MPQPMKRTLNPRHFEIPDTEVIALMKSTTPAERLEMAFASHRLVRQRLAGHFRTLHPEWTDEDVEKAIAGRFLGETV
ncbi:MAG: hypothetical protein WCH39_20345 [Schlesneria sp.]